MSPRRTHPKRRRRNDVENEGPIAPDIVTSAPEGWQARAISPARAQKLYRCPGCNQEIRPGTAHIVAWREDDMEGRRHWHTPCWRRAHPR
ncbi:MAG: ATP/GTP-binding protein [Actinomycetota bacterium]